MNDRLAVIVPTRSRPQNVAPILRAWTHTGAWAVADLWFVVDADDMDLPSYHKVFRAHQGCGSYRLHIQPSWQPLVPKLNAAAVGLRREYGYPALAFMGDDHLPRTQLWAHTLLSFHSRRPGFIYYGRDGLQDERLPTWWSMDGRIIDALGRMVPAPVQHLYCDNAIKELGKKAGRLGYLPDVLIEHMHPFVGKAKVDAQYLRVNRAEQYGRDANLFNSWLATQLDQDASLLAGIGG